MRSRRHHGSVFHHKDFDSPNRKRTKPMSDNNRGFIDEFFID